MSDAQASETETRYAEATAALEAVIGALPKGSEAVRAIEDKHQVPTYAKLGVALVRGEGVWVWDAEGKRYLDLYGGHAVALTGHGHPRVAGAIQAQAERLFFFSNLVYSDVRAAAVLRLAALAPEGLGQVFLCNSGAEANETALKLARKHTGRPRIVSCHEGFHGRTLGALGATGMAGYRDPAYPIPTAHTFVPYGDITAFRETVDQDVAAVILEPIPSMGGIQVADDAFFRELRALCDERGAMLIFDEVQTGFGRTGAPFFGQHVGVTPDLITGAKGIASGFPAGVVFVREALAADVKVGEQGTTFGGGPLACAAIAATCAVIEDEGLIDHAAKLGCHLAMTLEDVPGVESTTGRGLLFGVNLDRPAKPIVAALRDAGILAGTCGGRPNQIRLLPPLVLTTEHADLFAETLRRLLG
ncbi:MAG: aminotransferase class III-fold pyridoxal phosphate-dependent enzyme [Planctomycetota bacterium]|nr:aminotransferase class III-fold pyridoxal phosphate-dependent enzyme [Planctomycetota bacterium]